MDHTKYRTVYILLYPTRPFAAHCSIWIQDQSDDGGKFGRRIHATSDRLNGFEFEIVRHYNKSVDSRKPQMHLIGKVLGSQLRDDEHTGSEEELVDTTPRNAFEAACMAVNVPGPSLNRVPDKAEGTNKGVPKKTEVRDCQWWVMQVIEALVRSELLLGIMYEDGVKSDPREVVQALPKH